MSNFSKMKIAKKKSSFSTIKSQGQIQNMEMCARTGKYYATDKTSDKKVMNCSPYFTVLQYINNLEIKRSYQRKVNLENLKFKKIYRAV